MNNKWKSFRFYVGYTLLKMQVTLSLETVLGVCNTDYTILLHHLIMQSAMTTEKITRNAGIIGNMIANVHGYIGQWERNCCRNSATVGLYFHICRWKNLLKVMAYNVLSVQ